MSSNVFQWKTYDAILKCRHHFLVTRQVEIKVEIQFCIYSNFNLVSIRKTRCSVKINSNTNHQNNPQVYCSCRLENHLRRFEIEIFKQ